jgi:thioredoxin-related protein
MEPTDDRNAKNSQRAMPLLLVLLAIVLLAGRVAAHWMTAEKVDGLVHWTALDEAGSLAASSRKGLLLDFTAEWCGPCHVLDAEVFGDAQLANQINSRFVAVRVLDRQREEGHNAPAVARLQQQYGVRGFPTVLFLDGNGNELARMEGYAGREQFQRVMESVR